MAIEKKSLTGKKATSTKSSGKARKTAAATKLQTASSGVVKLYTATTRFK